MLGEDLLGSGTVVEKVLDAAAEGAANTGLAAGEVEVVRAGYAEVESVAFAGEEKGA